MTSRRGSNSRHSGNPAPPDNSIPNSVARRRAGTAMGSTFSSSSTRRGSRNNTSQNSVSDVYGSRYSHRSVPHRARTGTGRLPRAVRRHTTIAAPSETSPTLREASEQTPGPRRSARIGSRMSQDAAMETPSVVPFPHGELRSRATPTRPVSSAASSHDSLPVEAGWQWREFTSSPHLETRTDPLPPIHTPVLFTPTPITPPAAATPPFTPPFTPVPPAATVPAVLSYTPPAGHTTPHPDTPDTDIQSLEIVRVVPHRLIEIPADEPLEPRPPPRQRPASGSSSQGILRRARRLLRDNASPAAAQSAAPDYSEEMPSTSTQSEQQFPGSSNMSDDMLRGRLFQQAENEALNNYNRVLSDSASANERSQRLRLLRLSRRQDSDVTPRDRLISGLLRRRETQGESSAEGAELGGAEENTPTRLRMFEVPGQGAILVEDIRPEASLRMSLLQAQYLQEVLLRISSLLDNLHILSQMNERMEDDPRLRTILAFATLNPDNMTYEQLLMLDELLPRNQGATKEMIANHTSLQRYTKADYHENDNCIICITDFEENDGIRMLPCCHIYHFACVDNWLTRKKTCPMCRCSIDDKPSTAYIERLQKFRDFKK